MPSGIDEAGHTKAFDDPVAEHWGESQRAKRGGEQSFDPHRVKVLSPDAGARTILRVNDRPGWLSRE